MDIVDRAHWFLKWCLLAAGAAAFCALVVWWIAAIAHAGLHGDLLTFIGLVVGVPFCAAVAVAMFLVCAD